MNKYRWVITVICLVAALICYWIGFSIGITGFLVAGVLLELYWWVSIFKSEKEPADAGS